MLVVIANQICYYYSCLLVRCCIGCLSKRSVGGPVFFFLANIEISTEISYHNYRNYYYKGDFLSHGK